MNSRYLGKNRNFGPQFVWQFLVYLLLQVLQKLGRQVSAIPQTRKLQAIYATEIIVTLVENGFNAGQSIREIIPINACYPNPT